MRMTRRSLALAVFGLAVAGGVWIALSGDLSPAMLEARHAELLAWRAALGGWAVAGFFAVTALAAFVALPGIAVVTLAGGLLFGVLWGTLLVTAAATVGAVAAYALARAGFGDALWRRMAAGRAAGLAEGFRRNEIAALLLLRLAPAVPFLLANVLPALMGVRPGRYALTTFAGLLPGTAALALAGQALGDLAATGTAPATGTLVALLLGVPMLAVAAPVAARMLRRASARLADPRPPESRPLD
jgi:uncharacterized membrane protein YdjX (TVP38/TMEM64 family)